ncbi:MAG: DUF1501 domain-containing protein [Pseudomonadota bacterium]|nr:DUF1501 domain-containing protein [Pseudomonadota bacterium]
MTANTSRREFLRRASLLSLASGTAAPFAMNLMTMGSAAAQAAPTDYKALICLFLQGGNDSHHMVLATDPTAFNAYTAIRKTTDAAQIALDPASLLPIVPATAQAVSSGFGLHPNLGGVQRLFAAKRAAIVANVGPLIAPLTRAQWNAHSVPVPRSLFSHNDQISTWQASAPEGTRTGWAGRMGDLLVAGNAKSTFTCVSVSGNSLLLSGNTVLPFNVGANGSVAVAGLSGSLFGVPAGADAYRNIITGARSHLFEKQVAGVTNRSLAGQAELQAGMLPVAGVPTPTQYTNPNSGTLQTNSLATAFQTIARVIGGHAALGARRQIFFVNVGSFDTHDGQNTRLADFYARIGHAMEYFDQAMTALNLSNNVTTFTASDFGRTLASNGDGTDHGWGSHHMVFGGAVKGGDLYGSFPPYVMNGDQDVGGGRLLPTVSVEQYAGTMARWFGLSAGDLATVFPNFVNFGSQPLLNFI